ncbi:hypothetical protein EON68_01870 [archaeon]|nr:MAG: hypothetical protein EON68_01870 [archaeon]
MRAKNGGAVVCAGGHDAKTQARRGYMQVACTPAALATTDGTHAAARARVTTRIMHSCPPPD